ncbi:MAG: hypothetical protein AB7Q01_08550 [Gammaproteobacteria bacterium]
MPVYQLSLQVDLVVDSDSEEGAITEVYLALEDIEEPGFFIPDWVLLSIAQAEDPSNVPPEDPFRDDLFDALFEEEDN